MSGRDPGRGPAPAAALLLALAWLLATIWVRPLMLPDEGRYVGVAWEMVRSGHWLVPTLDGLPYFHKPPLFYWITATALSWFGNHEWAARMAPLLGALAGAGALYGFARRWAGATVANRTLLVLATQPLFYVAAQFANLDMLVAGCIAVTILASAHVVLEAQRARRSDWAVAAAWVFAGLGLLAKGLIGVVLPGLVIVAWLLVLRRLRLILSLLWWPAILLFLVVAAPWFVAMQGEFSEFAHYFFVVQHFQRFAQGGFNNVQPFWFYPVVLAVLTLPWFLWLPLSVRRRSMADPEHGPLRILLWLWVLALTVFFSLPKSKLVGYILPVTFPLALLIADAASQWAATVPRGRRLWQLSAAVAATICVGAIALSPFYAERSQRSLGLALASRAAPSDTVIFLRGYYFDVPFYAHLTHPVLVVDDWDKPELTARDNWARELLDAQRFTPASAKPVLLVPASLKPALCTAAPVWIVGSFKALPQFPELAGAAEIARHGETVLWRLAARPAADVTAAGCPGMPSENSPYK